MFAVFLCGCSFRPEEHFEFPATPTKPVIQIHGEHRFMTGTYDVTVMANGHVDYSNYPLPVARSELSKEHISSLLSEMRRTGFWTCDAQSLSNALTDVVVLDATKITLTAFWMDDKNVITFERDCLFSPVAKKCKVVLSLRHCVDLIEKEVLVSRLP